jgi:hypothetical protein
MTPAAQKTGEIAPGAWVQWLLVGTLASGLGMGGSAVYQRIQPPRPDPFTGTMAHELEERVNARIAELDRTGTRALQECRARVTALEASRDEVRTRLQRIEELLVELRIALGVGSRNHRGEP